MTSKRLLGLEFGRGIAATLVAMHHASNLLSQPRLYVTAPFHDLMRHFDIGVDFFFVLSGFITMWVHASDIGKRGRLGPYVMRRWTRIYPPYWCVLIPLSLLYFLFPDAGNPSQHEPANFVLSFFLLPNINQPILGVAWTLTYEVFFYAIFGTILVIGKRAWLALPLWAAAIFWFALFGDQTSWPQNFFLNSLNLEFMIGIVVARTLSIGRAPCPIAFLGGGLAAFALIVLLDFNSIGVPFPLLEHLILGIGGGCIIAGLVELERSGKLTFGRLAQVLGSASYSIYLVHSITESWASLLTWHLLKYLPSELAWLLLVGVGILAGLLFHRLVERPLTDFIRVRFNSTSVAVAKRI